MRTFLAFVASCLVAGLASASPYLYQQTFEGAATHTEQDPWDSGWSNAHFATPDALGIPAGPATGQYVASTVDHGLGFEEASWYLSPLFSDEPYATLPTGSFSFQVDIFLGADPEPQSYGQIITYMQGWHSDGESTLMASAIYFWTSYDGAGDGRQFTFMDYYTNSITTSPVTMSYQPGWYTMEIAYDYSDNVDPETGRPYVWCDISVYEQASFTPEGYRTGELMASMGFDWMYWDYHPFGPVVAPSDLQPAGMDVGTSTDFSLYFDNAGVGPLINTPEPSGLLPAAALSVVAGLNARRRQRAAARTR